MSSPVKVQDSNFIENKATGSGGGVYFAGSSVLPDLGPACSIRC
jgi:predicted outer membrane repeat protein